MYKIIFDNEKSIMAMPKVRRNARYAMMDELIRSLDQKILVCGNGKVNQTISSAIESEIVRMPELRGISAWLISARAEEAIRKTGCVRFPLFSPDTVAEAGKIKKVLRKCWVEVFYLPDEHIAESVKRICSEIQSGSIYPDPDQICRDFVQRMQTDFSSVCWDKNLPAVTMDDCVTACFGCQYCKNIKKDGQAFVVFSENNTCQNCIVHSIMDGIMEAAAEAAAL